jgi:hypothetical protein
MSEKKTYSTPMLTVHGKVEDITQGGSLPNSDMPHGVGPNAYS